MKNEWYKKREYKYLYLGSFAYNFANALFETFGTVLLYKNGVPLWLILLIYCFRFLITGIITPLFLTLSSKIGIAKVILISNIFSIISAYLMVSVGINNNTLIIFIIVMGLMGLSNPSSDALSSRYVETKYRGRFNGFLNITKVVSMFLASLLIAWGVISDNNIILSVIITLFFLLHYVFIKKIDYKPSNYNDAFKSSFKYLIKAKSNFKIIYALKATHIIDRLFIPLYLFIILNNFRSFSSVVTLSFLLQVITIFLIGKYTDKNLKRANKLVTIIRVIITSIFLFFKSKFIVSTNKIISDNFEKVYETSIQTSIQNIIKNAKESDDLLSAAGQMCLCFSEVIILLLLSLISVFIEERFFYIMFAISIISSVLTLIKINHSKT